MSPARRTAPAMVPVAEGVAIRRTLAWLVLGGHTAETVAAALGWSESFVLLLMFAPDRERMGAVLRGAGLTARTCRAQLLGLFDLEIGGERPMARLRRLAVKPPTWLAEAP